MKKGNEERVCGLRPDKSDAWHVLIDGSSARAAI
jgi:hypothetical protein